VGQGMDSNDIAKRNKRTRFNFVFVCAKLKPKRKLNDK
jgi:hypothetical protein